MGRSDHGLEIPAGDSPLCQRSLDQTIQKTEHLQCSKEWEIPIRTCCGRSTWHLCPVRHGFPEFQGHSESKPERYGPPTSTGRTVAKCRCMILDIRIILDHFG